MRVRTIVFGILAGAVGICAPAKADVQCSALVSGPARFSVYASAVIAFSESRAEEWGRIEDEVVRAFHAHVRELTGARAMGSTAGGRRFMRYTTCSMRRDGSGEWVTAQGNEELVRTGWTGGFGSARLESASPASATTRRNVSPSGAGRESRVYIMPPTAPGMQPVDSVQESEASRQAVAARYRQQQERERSIAASSARQQAEHQARLAESARQNAAHRSAMAENARQQEAYRRARAEWETRVAACQAGNRDACVARVTPQ